eukprot:scaffold65365_cov32-Prasinocladus_malaysianus.AAC.1
MHVRSAYHQLASPDCLCRTTSPFLAVSKHATPELLRSFLVISPGCRLSIYLEKNNASKVQMK